MLRYEWTSGRQDNFASEEAKDLLVQILRDIEEQRAWPGQTYYNIIVCMGKLAGGYRPIALMPMLYRLWTKIRRPHIGAWQSAWAGLWDAAVKGSSALKAAILGMHVAG